MDYNYEDAADEVYQSTGYDVTSYDATKYTYGADGIPLILWILYAVLIVVMVVSMWKVFVKAKKPGWAAIIPIYNTYVMLKIVGRPWWWLLLMLIPFVNIVLMIIVYNDMAKSFGKTVGWTVGLILLPFIFWPMLAFGSAKYKGPSAPQPAKS